MGASQIRFVTRSGTNNFHGSGFFGYRSDGLNANTWFNKRDGIEKAALLRKQPGFNIGGPIMFPGFNGRNKAFSSSAATITQTRISLSSPRIIFSLQAGAKALTVPRHPEQKSQRLGPNPGATVMS